MFTICVVANSRKNTETGHATIAEAFIEYFKSWDWQQDNVQLVIIKCDGEVIFAFRDSESLLAIANHNGLSEK